MVEEALGWFLALPRFTQLLILLGVATPLLTLRAYLNPPPPPPPPPADIDILLPDGKRARGYYKRKPGG